MNDTPKKFLPIETDSVYQISRIFWQCSNLRDAMDELVPVLRPYFIFDNMVLYLIDPMTLNLDVAYAKATGRGKSAEADVAWGELLAGQVIEQKVTIIQDPENSPEENRLRRPYTLGLPLLTQKEILGAVIFIRFGSPPYLPAEVALAEHTARLLSLTIQNERIRKERDRLEFQYRIFQVQEDFISTLSHEIRNPLGFIKGYTTTLLRKDAQWDKESQEEFLTIIDQETDRLQDLIVNLLDSAKLQSGQVMMNFETVRLDALMNDILGRAKLHHPDLKIISQMELPVTPIQADSRRLAQLFENIISNSVKYAPGSPVFITIKQQDSGVWIQIRDEGPGIPEKFAQRIFDRFFRVPDNRITIHGSGLGLFICKQIVQAHSGEISVKTTEGVGTAFEIYLPASP